MAEKKGVGHAYNVDFLNVVFAASSLFLFLSVIWMVWDDFDRDWKKTQRAFSQLESRSRRLNLQQAGRAVDEQEARHPDVAGRRRPRRTSPPTRRRSTSCRASSKDANNKLFRATHGLPDDEGDLRPGSLRLRGVARQRPAVRRRRKRSPRTRAPSWPNWTSRVQKATADVADIQKQLGQFTGEVVASAEVDRRAERRSRRGWASD